MNKYITQERIREKDALDIQLFISHDVSDVDGSHVYKCDLMLFICLFVDVVVCVEFGIAKTKFSE